MEESEVSVLDFEDALGVQEESLTFTVPGHDRGTF